MFIGSYELSMCLRRLPERNVFNALTRLKAQFPLVLQGYAMTLAVRTPFLSRGIVGGPLS